LVEQISIVVDPDDGSYIPSRVAILAGSIGSVSNVCVKSLSRSDQASRKIPLLMIPLPEAYQVIEIHIEECNRGTYSHMH